MEIYISHSKSSCTCCSLNVCTVHAGVHTGFSVWGGETRKFEDDVDSIVKEGVC